MLTLGGKSLQLPILQGGMGVGVSLGGLAGAVAACGGMGCISTADAGYREPDFARDPAAANHRALTAEIQKAKAIAGGMGLVAINAMVATRDYAEAIRTAVTAGVDAVVSGAGLPLELPGIVGTKEVAIAPIVSSARAAKLILRRWAKGFDRTADFVVIEGCKAGGHLGFAEEDLLADRCQTLDEILPGVLAEVKPYEEQYGHAIPVFVAGGVYTGADMAHFTKLGAAGVQLATRLIPTYECDASQTYKDVLLAAAMLCTAQTDTLGRRRMGWLGVFGLVYAVGAMSAMYITYTPVGMVRIVGLQTRYFLPVWLLLVLAAAAVLRRVLAPRLTAAKGEALAVTLCGWYAFAGAVLLFQHYFVGPVYTIYK